MTRKPKQMRRKMSKSQKILKSIRNQMIKMIKSLMKRQKMRRRLMKRKRMMNLTKKIMERSLYTKTSDL